MKRKIYRRRKPLKHKVTEEQANELRSLVLDQSERFCLMETTVRRQGYELRAIQFQLGLFHHDLPVKLMDLPGNMN